MIKQTVYNNNNSNKNTLFFEITGSAVLHCTVAPVSRQSLKKPGEIVRLDNEGGKKSQNGGGGHFITVKHTA